MTGSDLELDVLEEKKKRKKKRKVKRKKSRGGKRDGKGASSKGYSLRDWFKGGGWVQTGGKYDGKPCARQKGQKTKPYCRDPDDRAKLSKKERDKRARKKRKEDPNPDRRGKAKNVRQKKRKTKKKNESMEYIGMQLTVQQLDTLVSEEIELLFEELDSLEEKKKKKKPCKKAKGKRYVKRVNGRCRSFGQAGKAKGGGDRIRPGTKKGDAYCARSAKIKKCKNPPCANDLSRKKWKCRGSKSMKE